MMPSKKLFLTSTVLFVLVSLPFVGSVGASSELWSQTYGGEHGNVVYTFDIAYSLVETSDGGYALAGYTRNANVGVSEGWLVKTDANGDVVWNLTYGEGGFRSLVKTADGGFALAGSIGSFSAGNYDFWLVKTDAQGIPEFPSWLILPLFLIATLIVTLVRKRLLRN